MLLLALLFQDATMYGTVDADAAAVYQSVEIPPVPDALAGYAGGDAAKPEEIRAALAPFEPILAKLGEAARAKRCAWNYPGRERFGDVPHLGTVISAGRLFAARARYRLESGDLDGAIDDAAAGWGVGIHYLSDGPVMTTLGGMIALVLTNGAFQISLPGKVLSPVQLRRLGAHAEAIEAAFPSFRRIMEGEKRIALGGVDQAIEDFRALVELIEGVGGKAPKALKENEAGKAVWKEFQDLLHADRAASRKTLRRRVDEVWEDVLQDADQPIGSTTSRLNLDELKERPTKRWVQYKRDGDPQMGLEAAADTYIALVLPALSKAKPNVAKVRLGIGLRGLACRVELAERARAAYPETLEGLKPPADPWNGQAVKYRRFDEKGRRGFVITATGPNRDWEARIRTLMELDFNYDKFEANGASESDSTGWTVWQVRR